MLTGTSVDELVRRELPGEVVVPDDFFHRTRHIDEMHRLAAFERRNLPITLVGLYTFVKMISPDALCLDSAGRNQKQARSDEINPFAEGS